MTSRDEVIRAEVKRLLAAGWTAKAGSRHHKLYSPRGVMVTVPQIAPDRVRQNWLHQVRRVERNENGLTT